MSKRNKNWDKSKTFLNQNNAADCMEDMSIQNDEAYITPLLDEVVVPIFEWNLVSVDHVSIYESHQVTRANHEHTAGSHHQRRCYRRKWALLWHGPVYFWGLSMAVFKLNVDIADVVVV